MTIILISQLGQPRDRSLEELDCGEPMHELKIGIVRLVLTKHELEKIHRYTGEHLAKIRFRGDSEPEPGLASGWVQAEPKIETNETPPMHPSPVECDTCKGTGSMLKTIERGAHQGNVIRSDCPECKGKGHP